jgi:hypothetical protein
MPGLALAALVPGGPPEKRVSRHAHPRGQKTVELRVKNTYPETITF